MQSKPILAWKLCSTQVIYQSFKYDTLLNLKQKSCSWNVFCVLCHSILLSLSWLSILKSFQYSNPYLLMESWKIDCCRQSPEKAQSPAGMTVVTPGKAGKNATPKRSPLKSIAPQVNGLFHLPLVSAQVSPHSYKCRWLSLNFGEQKAWNFQFFLLHF